jgi:hypothetical protein
VRRNPVVLGAAAFVVVLVVGWLAPAVARQAMWRSRVEVAAIFPAAKTPGKERVMAGRLVVSDNLLIGVAESAGFNWLRIYDITDSTSPKQAGEVALSVAVEGKSMPARVHDFAVDGATAYAIASTGPEASDHWSAQALDISDPVHPKVVGTLPIEAGNIVLGMTAQDGYVYVITIGADAATALRSLDMRDPSHSAEIAVLPLGAGRVDIELVGDTLWIDTRSSLTAVDVADSSHPRVVGTAALPPDCSQGDVATNGLQGAGAKVLIGGEDLCVFDSANPAAPRLIRQIERAGYIFLVDLAAVGDRGFLSGAGAPDAGESSLAIFDLTSPPGPQRYAYFDDVKPGSLAVKGNYVFTSGYWFSDHDDHELIVLEVK